ncbi:MAG: hypothetical protein JNJ43_18910 [Anaerolineales bacterium]|nr:hypothetical protein [Anaerolineales bacterium]
MFAITHILWIYAEYDGWDSYAVFKIINGVGAFIAFGVHVLNFQDPRKQLTYASSFFALFIALFGIKLIINEFDIYTSEIQNPIILLGLIAAIFLWFEQ